MIEHAETTVDVFFFLLESTTCSYLGNEMISLGTKFPCQAWFTTWTYATLYIPMHNCIPVCMTSASNQSKLGPLCLIHKCVMMSS